MTRWSTPLVRWQVLLLAVLLVLAPTASRLVSVVHPAVVYLCHAGDGDGTAPDPNDTGSAAHLGDCCPLCHIGWAPPPAAHNLPVPTGWTRPSVSVAAPQLALLTLWTPHSPRAPPPTTLA